MLLSSLSSNTCSAAISTWRPRFVTCDSCMRHLWCFDIVLYRPCRRARALGNMVVATGLTKNSASRQKNNLLVVAAIKGCPSQSVGTLRLVLQQSSLHPRWATRKTTTVAKTNASLDPEIKWMAWPAVNAAHTDFVDAGARTLKSDLHHDQRTRGNFSRFLATSLLVVFFSARL